LNPSCSIRVERLKNRLGDERRLCDLLHEADEDYLPRLSSLVDINEYSRKLIENAAVFVGVRSGEDMGAVAIYANDQKMRCSYISTITVLRKFRESGLGMKLLDHAEHFAKGQEMRQILLETSISALAAQKLYKKCGYELVGDSHQGSYEGAICFRKTIG
jgi:ribosomal protein S18 acetylase RimI-like enzyme